MFKNIYTENLNIAVFDIETTGLRPLSDMIISASFIDEDGGGLRQYFCEDPQSEFLIINKIVEEFSKLDAVITYNGFRFDIPFVKTRAQKYGIDVPDIFNIDVYKLLKKYWPVAKSMSSLSQGSVEYAMGLRDSRTDTIDGAECIPLYNDYLLTGDMDNVEKILLHNADDVRQLSKISNNLSFLPFHKVAFENGYILKARASYPGADDVRINMSDISIEDSKIVAIGSSKQNLPGLDIENDFYHLQYDSFSGAIRLELFLREIDCYKYTDLTKLDVNPIDFKDFEGYNHDFLILIDNTKIYYKEINAVISELIRRIVCGN